MRKTGFGRLTLAAAAYAGFAVYLFSGRFEYFERWQWLLPVNAAFGAAGCYVLSRRWVSSFVGSFFAGAVYGFGPFMLALAKYHETAGFLAACVPWLFCPAAFGARTRWRPKVWLLAVLPFAAIVLYFQLTTRLGLFAVSTQTSLRWRDMASLFAPLVIAERDIMGTTMLGVYHVAAGPLVMGGAMMLAARRLQVIAVVAAGTALACCGPVLAASPVMWLTIPVLCCSVLVGEGVQGLSLAGTKDRGWVMAVAICQAALAIAALFLATKYFQFFLSLADKYARLFVLTGEMYLLGAVAVMTIFFLARANLRLRTVRQVILSVSIALDIFLGAGFIIDRVL